MGIKTSILTSQLPSQYQHHRLIPTVHGVMATTYLLDDSYVLKLFEHDTPTEILENEITLLSKLNTIPVPKVIDRFKIDGDEVILYTQMQGESISQPGIQHIKEVALFLKAFHTQSKDIDISCKERFKKVQLKQLIDSTDNPSTSYIKYALLYYATTRFIAGRDYPILLKRLENLS